MFLVVCGSIYVQILTCGRCNARQSCLPLAWDFLGKGKEAERFVLLFEVNGCLCSQCIFNEEVAKLTVIFFF